jgi:hypothetical protein
LYQLRVKVATEKQCSKPFAFACHHLLDSRVFYVVASSAVERDQWVAAITEARDHCTWGKKEWGVVAELGDAAGEVADRGIEVALTKLGGSDAAFAMVMLPQPPAPLNTSGSSGSETKSRSRPASARTSPSSSRPASPARSRPDSPIPSTSPTLSPSSSTGSTSSSTSTVTTGTGVVVGIGHMSIKCSNECTSDATIKCLDCKEDFCVTCDAMLHKRAATSTHNRTPLVAPSSSSTGRQQKAANAA